jgi:hypothetical protein
MMEQISSMAATQHGFDDCRASLKQEFDLRRGNKKREKDMENGKDLLYDDN